MIFFLNGKIDNIFENKIVLDVSGVGYILESTLRCLSYNIGDEVKIFTEMVVSENFIGLYGFYDLNELKLFQKIKSVSKIGPKTAINILNSMPTDLLVKCIKNKDENILKNAKSIGLKTANRIILELSDKLDDILIDDSDTDVPSYDSDILEDIYITFESLGYSKFEVDKALKHIDISNLDVKSAIKSVLKYMNGNWYGK